MKVDFVLKNYVVEYIKDKRHKDSKLLEVCAIDAEDALECCLLDFPKALVKAVYKEVKL